MDVACPGCGADVVMERWVELIQPFIDSGIEPDYECPHCGWQTPLTTLPYAPGAYFGRLCLDFDYAGDPDTTTPTFLRLQELINAGPLQVVALHF